MEAYIYDAVRSPRGSSKKQGALSSIPPTALLSQLFYALDKRLQLKLKHVDDIILGCVTQVKEQGGNIGKVAALAANLPVAISGMTVNRYCASSLEAVNIAATKVHSKSEDLIIAGGVESISRVPMFSDEASYFSDREIIQKTQFVQMGVSADIIATLERFSRTELDEYAAESHRRAFLATKNNYFSRSLVPIFDEDNNLLLDHDELIRGETTAESFKQLVPVFSKFVHEDTIAVIKENFPAITELSHLHHPGNSPALADGASLLLIGNKMAQKKLDRKPRARIIGCTSAATNPLLLTGGQAAVEKLLTKFGFSKNDMDLIEYNESFAATVLKFRRDFNIDSDKLNVNGGIIAMGHAMGATGGMLIINLLEELERRDLKRGLVAASGSGGVGCAIIIERVLS